MPVSESDSHGAEAHAPAAPRRRSTRGRYISDTIVGRRSRMLEVAKQMIAEGADHAFTLREMSRRAKVSVTTVYATFGDKEGLIAAAIEDYYANLPLASAPPTTNIAVVLDNTDLAVEAILANKPYARQYSALFFSDTVSPRVHRVIRDTTSGASRHMDWYRKAIRDGEVVPGVTLDFIADKHADEMMLVLHEWARGRIRDEDLSRSLKTAFLMMARGLTFGRAQAKAETHLRAVLRAALAPPP